jgi:hypothetical protein
MAHIRYCMVWQSWRDQGQRHGWYQVTGSGLALLHHAVSSSR